MRVKTYRYWNIVLILGLLLSVWPMPVQAQSLASPSNPLPPTVGAAVRADVSPALRDLAPIPDQSGFPKPDWFQETRLWVGLSDQSGFPKPDRSAPDPVRQAVHSPLTMPAFIHNFEGVDNVNGVHPPDTQGDIGYDPATGTKHYVQWVNSSFAIWDVTNTPTQIYGPVNGNTLWQGFGGACETTNHGDPITLFDTMSNRWLMSQFSITGPYYQCIAISQTADPTGAWYRYAFLVSSTKMNDYPHFGVWPDGYYMTVNQFTNGTSWGGAGVFVFDRAKMLTGDPSATFQSFDLYSVNPNFGGMLPSDLDGQNLPPTGAPNYFLEVDDGPDEIKLWEFHVDWTTPANTTFGLSGQPNATLPVAAWTELCPSTWSCIPQPGTSEGLDGIGDRLMYRLAYRNFGTHESLVVNHSVNAGGGVAGVRWYEVRDPDGTPTLYQQGTFAPDSDNRWMASVAMDAVGNMALGYSVSSSSVYPSIRYTGRLANDPLGQMTQGEATLVNGSGSQTSTHHRWGDYSMMGIDPVDDCTFWFTTEYMATTGYAPWSTRIGSFRFPSCGMSQPGALRGVVSESGPSAAIAGAVVSAKAATGTLESTVTGSTGAYALVLPGDTYTITASKYGYQPYQQSGVIVNEGLTTTLDIQLTPIPRYQVSGYVTDARAGWPLYARIQVTGDPYNPPAPDNATWTDPVTGYYSLTLVADMDYVLEVEAWPAGYRPATVSVNDLSAATVVDIAVQPDMVTCAAPGYQQQRQAVYEFDFTGGLPVDWAVTEDAGNGVVWRFDDPKSRSNRTGGDGTFAIVDSDHAGPKAVNTELRTGALDLSALSEVILEFSYDFRWYAFGEDETVAVDVSINGGTVWGNVWQRSGASDRGPKTARVDISSLAAGESDVRLRFHYFDAQYEWWWQVDDVFLGTLDCEVASGGLAVGEVFDTNTQTAVAARVTGVAAATTATPLSNAGAFYMLFTPTDAPTLTATATGYAPAVLYPTVVQSDSVRQDITLDAGVLESTVAFSPSVTVQADLTTTHYFTLTNSGGYLLDFDIEMLNAPLPDIGMTGPYALPVRRVSPKHIHDRDARGVRSFAAPDTVLWPGGGAVVQTWPSGLPAPWGVVVLPATVTRPEGTVWVNDTRFGGGEDQHHAFSVAGAPVGVPVESFPNVDIFAADMAYDPVANTIWQVNVGGDTCIYELNAMSLRFTGESICPAFGVSERGLAYDPVSETFFAGSWNDQAIVHFDKSGQILDSWDTGLNLGGLAYNPVSGLIFAMSNASSGYDVYVLDARDGYALRGGFDITGLGEFEQAGLDMDADGHLWTLNQITGEVLQVTSGETPLVPWNEVAWLTADPLSGTLGVGAQQQVAVTWDAAGMAAGDYAAHLRINNSTPYGELRIPMTLHVVDLYAVTAESVPALRYGDPAVTVRHTVWVTNTGIAADTFDVAISGADWATTAPDAVGPLVSEAGASLEVAVTLPADGLCGARDSLTVTLTSRGNRNRTAAVVLTTVANAQYAVAADVSPAALYGAPGETVTATVAVHNTGNCTGSFEVAAMGRWPVSMLHPVVQVVPGAAQPVVAEVRIPTSALAGDSDVALVGVSSLDDVAQGTTLSLRTTAEAVYAAVLSPAVITRAVFSGNDTRYTFTLTNLGNITDTFTLITAGDDFPTAVSPVTVTLDVGASAPLSVTVTVPEATVPGVADGFVLHATGTATVAHSMVTTTAVLSYGVALAVDPVQGQALAGMTVTYTLWITNTGGAKDTFDLEMDGNMWLTALPKEVGPLAAKAGTLVPLVVVVPASATVGTRDMLTVTAISQAAPAHAAVLTLTTEVVECWPVSGARFIYMPVPPLLGTTITFTGSVAAGTLPVTYTWNFGAVGAVVTHTFPTSTGRVPYTVVMTATNGCGVDAVSQVLVLEMKVETYAVYLPLVLRR